MAGIADGFDHAVCAIGLDIFNGRSICLCGFGGRDISRPYKLSRRDGIYAVRSVYNLRPIFSPAMRRKSTRSGLAGILAKTAIRLLDLVIFCRCSNPPHLQRANCGSVHQGQGRSQRQIHWESQNRDIQPALPLRGGWVC